jgi:tetratricopeptide (TPR) repeat protein
MDKPGQPPDLDAALPPLLEQALVAVDRDPETGQPLRFHIHPGVADAGRTSAGSGLAAAVDTELAAFWLDMLNAAREREGEQMGGLVRRAALAAGPYLIRRQQWGAVLYPIAAVLARDSSPGTAAALLPLLDKAREGGRGTDVELEAGQLHARALGSIRPHHAASALRDLLDTAVAHQDFALASTIVGDLVNLCLRFGRLDEALQLAEDQKEYTRQAGYGPWTQLIADAVRLQILGLQGHAEQVLTAIEQLRPVIAAMPESSDTPESANPFNVRELIFDTGRRAARDLGRWQQALDLNSEALKSKRERGASDADQAFAAANDYGPLLNLGRIGEARTLLMWCRAVFEAEHAVDSLGKVLSALADVEDAMGHGGLAIELEKDALRLKYTAGDPDTIGVSHHNLANYLGRYTGEVQQVWAHRLAAAIVGYQTGTGLLLRRIRALALLLARGESPPESFRAVCEIVDQIEGVQLEDLVARLPTNRSRDGQTAMDEVLRLARSIPAEEALDLERHLRGWEPVIAGLVAAHRGDTDAANVIDQALTKRGEQTDWGELVAVLRRIEAGERDPALADGLDPIDTAVVRRVLDALAGTVTVDLDAWHALTEPADDVDWVGVMVAAAGGDTDAQAMLAPVLDGLAADPQGTALAAALRRILAGDRTPALDQLDSDAATLVTVILDQLTSPLDPSAEPPAPSTTPPAQPPTPRQPQAPSPERPSAAGQAPTRPNAT